MPCRNGARTEPSWVAHGAVSAQAPQDPLTGLPSRRALDLRLAEEVGAMTSRPCAALIDLDRFKDVDDMPAGPVDRAGRARRVMSGARE